MLTGEIFLLLSLTVFFNLNFYIKFLMICLKYFVDIK